MIRAKSVAKKTWYWRPTERFKAKQKFRASVRSEQHKAVVRTMGGDATKEALAAKAGISVETARKYVAKPQTTSAAKLKPWEKLGVSKATYYRDLKDGSLAQREAMAARKLESMAVSKCNVTTNETTCAEPIR